MTQAKKISWDGLHAMVQQHLKRWHIQESELLNMVPMAQIEVSSATIVIDGKNRNMECNCYNKLQWLKPFSKPLPRI